MSATITGLFIYPVKSLAAVSLQEVQVLPTGLKGDRQWMLVDAKGRFISQREIPKMASIKTSFDGVHLTLHSSGKDSVSISLDDNPPFPSATYQIWKDEVQGFAESEAVSLWLTETLGEFRGGALRLVRFNNNSQRKVGTKYLAEQGSDLKLADACPFLITCEASLKSLNDKLPKPMPMDRFRANIVMTNTEALEEYQWQWLTSEQLKFAMIGPCQRCPVTSIDQTEGVVATPGQPLQTLMNDFPLGNKNLPYFGLHAHLPGKETGVLKVGDMLTASLRQH